MNGSEELCDIMCECMLQHNKVADWLKQHLDDDIFDTEEGDKLRNHLGGMLKEGALTMLQCAKIELMYGVNPPDIPEETREAINKALEES